MATMTRVQMEAEINAGRGVMYDRQVITAIADLPTQDEIDDYRPVRNPTAVRNTLWVDPDNSNANAGTRGDSAEPFPTIVAALQSAQSGDTIELAPGDYDEHIGPYLLSGIKINGPDATLRDTSPLSGGVIDDSSDGADGALDIVIILKDIIRAAPPPYDGVDEFPVIHLSNANSFYDITCRRIVNQTYKGTAENGSSINPCGILASAGRGIIQVRRDILAMFYDGLLSYAGATHDVTVHADQIIGGYYADGGDPDNILDFYADGDASFADTGEQGYNLGEGGELGGTQDGTLGVWRVFAREWGSNNSYGVATGNIILKGTISQRIFGKNEGIFSTANGADVDLNVPILESATEEGVYIAHTGTYQLTGARIYGRGTNKVSAFIDNGTLVCYSCSLIAHSGAAAGANGAADGTLKLFRGSQLNKATATVTVVGTETVVSTLV